MWQAIILMDQNALANRSIVNLVLHGSSWSMWRVFLLFFLNVSPCRQFNALFYATGMKWVLVCGLF
jgi:hypothetical protein